MLQKDLVISSGLHKSRVSRIINGAPICFTEQDVEQLALGLKLTPEERDKLRYLVWPELHEIDKALINHENVVKLNCRLAELGLPLLGKEFLT